MSYPLADFLEATDLDNIYSHFDKWSPKEGCGLFVVRKGKKYWLPCDNLSDKDDNFILDTKVFTLANRAYDITAIVHSHVNASPEPSNTDIEVCNSLNIPFVIYSFPSMEKVELLPPNTHKPLLGREYEFGTKDCFEAARDYYREKLNILLPPRIDFEDDWWDKGLDYFTEDFIAEWGFKRVSNPKKGDLLIFSVQADVGNHCGIYLDNDIFFHHAVNRLSCRENLYPYWKRFLTGIYRYET